MCKNPQKKDLKLPVFFLHLSVFKSWLFFFLFFFWCFYWSWQQYCFKKKTFLLTIFIITYILFTKIWWANLEIAFFFFFFLLITTLQRTNEAENLCGFFFFLVVFFKYSWKVAMNLLLDFEPFSLLIPYTDGKQETCWADMHPQA